MDAASRKPGALAHVDASPAVELRELQVFLTVAEELHFSRAAERLGIDRSRVSQVVKGLEVKVGGRLLERTSRRVRLTAVGEQLMTEVVRPYRELQNVVARAHQTATGVGGTLRVGTYTRLNFGPHWLQITRAFKAGHPDCAVELIDTGDFGHNALDVLRAGDVDMLATRLPVSDDDMTIGPILSREARVLLVARDDPLAAHESVGVEDFADRVVTDGAGAPREMMNAFVPPVTPDGRRLRRVNLTSFDDVLVRVAAGELAHPTVASFLRYYRHDGVVAVPIRDLPSSETGLIWLTANRSPNVAAFARTAADVLAKTELDHENRT